MIFGKHTLRPAVHDRHVLALDKACIFQALVECAYNETRTHLGLGKDTPLRRSVQRSGPIVTIPILSGLHHRYARI